MPAIRNFVFICLLRIIWPPGFSFHRRNIFNMRGKYPPMAEWILELARAVAVKLVLDWPKDLQTFDYCLVGKFIDVFDINHQTYSRSTDRFRAQGSHIRKFVRRHKYRVSDLHLGMTDHSGASDTKQFLGAKGTLVK